MLRHAWLLAVLMPFPVSAQAVEYARPRLLVEVEELTRHTFGGGQSFSEQGVVLLDVRPKVKHQEDKFFKSSRSTLWIDVGEWKTAFGNGQDAAGWSERITRIADPRQTIIVFDETVSPNAARVWWILKYWGANDVRVLNGGYVAWREKNIDDRLSSRLSTGVSPSSRKPFEAKPQVERLATAGEVARQLALPKAACLVDARSSHEVAKGMIRSAQHSDWVNYVNPATGRFRSAAELKTLLDNAGFDPGQPATAYCRTGGRAAVVAFAMELMGAERVANYYGSWNEWSRLPDAPIARPLVGAGR